MLGFVILEKYSRYKAKYSHLDDFHSGIGRSASLNSIHCSDLNSAAGSVAESVHPSFLPYRLSLFPGDANAHREALEPWLNISTRTIPVHQIAVAALCYYTWLQFLDH